MKASHRNLRDALIAAGATNVRDGRTEWRVMQFDVPTKEQRIPLLAEAAKSLGGKLEGNTIWLASASGVALTWYSFWFEEDSASVWLGS